MSSQSLTVRDLLVAAFAFASGSMDALSYLALDGIFVSFMSGSTIFLGLRIGAGNVPSALNASAAIIGYVGGVALAAYIAYPTSTQEKL